MTIQDLIEVIGYTITIFSLGYKLGRDYRDKTQK